MTDESLEEKCEEEFEEVWDRVQGKSNNRNTIMYRNSKHWYLQGRMDESKVREEEIGELKKALGMCGLALMHGGTCPYLKEAK